MNADPLADLKDIRLPAEPGWWPPAIGWWLLLAVILLGLTALLLWVRQRRRRRAPLQAALAELAELQRADSARQLPRLHQLLRRAARQRYGTGSASLGSTEFARFLQEHAPAELRDGPWQDLATAPYRPQSPARHGELIAHARLWIEANLAC